MADKDLAEFMSSREAQSTTWYLDAETPEIVVTRCESCEAEARHTVEQLAKEFSFVHKLGCAYAPVADDERSRNDRAQQSSCVQARGHSLADGRHAQLSDSCDDVCKRREDGHRSEDIVKVRTFVELLLDDPGVRAWCEGVKDPVVVLSCNVCESLREFQPVDLGAMRWEHRPGCTSDLRRANADETRLEWNACSNYVTGANILTELAFVVSGEVLDANERDALQRVDALLRKLPALFVPCTDDQMALNPTLEFVRHVCLRYLADRTCVEGEVRKSASEPWDTSDGWTETSSKR